MIALLTFLDNIKDMADNCDVCKGKALQDQGYLQNDGPDKLYEAYTANKMSAKAHVYHRTWQLVINTLIQRFSIEKVL